MEPSELTASDLQEAIKLTENLKNTGEFLMRQIQKQKDLISMLTIKGKLSDLEADYITKRNAIFDEHDTEIQEFYKKYPEEDL